MENNEKTTTESVADKIARLNEKLAKAKTAKFTYRINYTEKNKALILTKATLEELNKDGVEVEKVYYSYNADKELWNDLKDYLETEEKYSQKY